MLHILKRYKQAYQQEIKKHQQGISLLIVIIIIGSALLIITTSALVVGLGERQIGYISQRGDEALALADGCLDEAKIRIRRNTSYGLGQGALPLSLANGSCTIQITDLGANQRQIDSVSTVVEFTKHIRATIQINAGILTSLTWEERVD